MPNDVHNMGANRIRILGELFLRNLEIYYFLCLLCNVYILRTRQVPGMMHYYLRIIIPILYLTETTFPQHADTRWNDSKFNIYIIMSHHYVFKILTSTNSSAAFSQCYFTRVIITQLFTDPSQLRRTKNFPITFNIINNINVTFYYISSKFQNFYARYSKI